jgi:thiamine biosynthesis protein ThiS
MTRAFYFVRSLYNKAEIGLILSNLIFQMLKIKIILNGEEKFLERETTIAQLVLELGLEVQKIAIEKDLEIINPDQFSKVILKDGSRVEIVHFIGGG